MPFFCRVPLDTHGECVCRVPDKWHTANWAFAVPSAAVGGSPSATDGEDFAVCQLSLCRVLGAHGELANSGSGEVVATDHGCLHLHCGCLTAKHTTKA